MLSIRKLSAAVALATVVATAGSAMAAPTVPGAVYSDQQAAGVNKPVTQIQQDLQKAGVQDVKPTDWFAGSVTVILQAGLMKPAADGSFQPDKPVNGNEGIAVFAKVLGIAAKNDSDEAAAVKMRDAGLIDSTKPDTDLSRLDTAWLIAKALGVDPKPIFVPSEYPFGDFEGLSPADRGMLKALYDLGIFKGYEDKTFRPGNILTRAEIAILIDRILGSAQ